MANFISSNSGSSKMQAMHDALANNPNVKVKIKIKIKPKGDKNVKTGKRNELPERET